jgi:GrpB-like predicted nucleotidyltransferase (UPF0157 family)
MTEANSREVVIAGYDPAWPLLFAAERDRILAIAPEAIERIEHVGSTSIPGLAAKPIIDVLGLLRRPLTEVEIEAIAAPGYEYRGEQGTPGRQYFSRRLPAPGFHLHFHHANKEDGLTMLRFRDYLREHEEAAHEYEALKRNLAAQFRDQPYAYQEAKTAFVEAINAEAGAKAGKE